MRRPRAASPPSGSSACSCVCASGDAVLLGQRPRSAGAVRGHDRVHQPESRCPSWAATASSTCPQYLSADDPRYAQTRRGRAAHVHGRARPHQSRVRPALGEVLRRVPRPVSPSPSASPTTARPRPPSRRPVANLFLTDSCQLHPHDRTISGSFGLGIAAARRAAAGVRRPMRPLDGRTVIVAAAAALPPLALLATGRAPAAPVLALACIAAITAGLVVLERGLRAAGLASVSVATSLLVLYGTGLVWHELVAPGVTALTFAAGVLVTVAWSRRPGRHRGDAIARGGALGLVLGTLALLADVASGAPALAGDSFRARQPLRLAARAPLLDARPHPRPRRPRPARRARASRCPGGAERALAAGPREREPAPVVERRLRQRAPRCPPFPCSPSAWPRCSRSCAPRPSAVRCASPPSRARFSWPGTSS